MHSGSHFGLKMSTLSTSAVCSFTCSSAWGSVLFSHSLTSDRGTDSITARHASDVKEGRERLLKWVSGFVNLARVCAARPKARSVFQFSNPGREPAPKPPFPLSVPSTRGRRRSGVYPEIAFPHWTARSRDCRPTNGAAGFGCLGRGALPRSGFTAPPPLFSRQRRSGPRLQSLALLWD